MDAGAETLFDRLLELTIVLGRDMDSELERSGLTPSRAHLLWVLNESGPSMQQTLAMTMEMSPRNVTGLVDGLVDGGFVTRQPHPSDRRAFLVTLSARGAEGVASMQAERRRLAMALFGQLSKGDMAATLRAMDEALTRLHELVEAAAARNGESS